MKETVRCQSCLSPSFVAGKEAKCVDIRVDGGRREITGRYRVNEGSENMSKTFRDGCLAPISSVESAYARLLTCIPGYKSEPLFLFIDPYSAGLGMPETSLAFIVPLRRTKSRCVSEPTRVFPYQSGVWRGFESSTRFERKGKEEKKKREKKNQSPTTAPGKGAASG